jgi:hypothetical protein
VPGQHEAERRQATEEDSACDGVNEPVQTIGRRHAWRVAKARVDREGAHDDEEHAAERGQSWSPGRAFARPQYLAEPEGEAEHE